MKNSKATKPESREEIRANYQSSEGSRNDLVLMCGEAGLPSAHLDSQAKQSCIREFGDGGFILGHAAIFVGKVADGKFTESGTYFVKDAGDQYNDPYFVQSLGKKEFAKIPAELTTMVGGYDTTEKTELLFDGVIPSDSFTEGV